MLNKFLDIIYEKSPFQKKKLAPFLEKSDSQFWERANTFAQQLENYLSTSGWNIKHAVDAYLKVCADTLTEQVKFRRGGCYSCANQNQAFDKIYNNEAEMYPYMIGLALSNFLWENHYAIYSFWLENLVRWKGTIDNYLEIGPGHGLFLAAALNELEAKHYLAIDISPTSLNLCQDLLPFLSSAISPNLVTLRKLNALDMEPSQKYELVIMGEVIEHLDDPRPVLRKIADLLTPEGHAFLTTCANCPAIDHVYLFRNVQEIRELFNACGLYIEEECVLYGETLQVRGMTSDYRLINYAAVVRRGDN